MRQDVYHMTRLTTLISEASPLVLTLMGIVLTVGIEAVTIALRFGLDMQATRDTGLIGRFTFGLRIHHGYLGVILLLIVLFVHDRILQRMFLILGSSLVASDLIHHFLVLWPLTGSPEFDLRYPRK